MSKKLDDELWYIILKCLEIHNNTGYTFDSFEFGTRTLDVFPSEPTNINGEWIYCDEQANRFGQSLLDVTMRIREFYQLPYFEDGYELRTEFHVFPTVTDVFNHFKRNLLAARPELIQ